LSRVARWFLAGGLTAACFLIPWQMVYHFGFFGFPFITVPSPADDRTAFSLAFAGAVAAFVGLGASAWAAAKSEKPGQDGAAGPAAGAVGLLPQPPRLFRPRRTVPWRLSRLLWPRGQALVLHGPTGAGKTALAAHYAEAALKTGHLIAAWISAGDEQHVIEGLAEVANRFSVRQAGSSEKEAAAAARDWLEQPATGQSLLVFDDVHDATVVEQWRPRIGPSRVIVTTTSQDVAGQLSRARLRPVTGFSDRRAKSFLRKPLDGMPAAATKSGADALAKELGNLPLALAQARFVAQKRGLSYPEFSELLRTSALPDVFEATAGERAVHVAISMALDSAAASAPVQLGWPVAELTGVLATVAVAAGREIRFSAGSVRKRVLDACLAPAGTAAVDQALGALSAGSLLSYAQEPHVGPRGTAIVISPLVRRVICERARLEGTLYATVAAAVKGLEKLQVPADEVWKKRTLVQEYADHARTLLVAATGGLDVAAAQAPPGSPLPSPALLSLGASLVRQLNLIEDYSRAARLANAVIAECEVVLKEDDRLTISLVGQLTLARLNLGDFAEAKGLSAQYQALTSSLDDDDPELSAARDLLEKVRLETGLPGDTSAPAGPAQPAHGPPFPAAPGQPDRISELTQQADAYAVGGQAKQAEAAYKQAYELQRAAAGDNDVRTLTLADALGSASLLAGHAREAVPVLRKALQGRKRLLGADHRDTATTRANLGAAFEEEDRPGKAARMYERSHRALARELGPQHPDVSILEESLARARHHQRRLITGRFGRRDGSSPS
jgi:tetratricopeptide (TPR) repeat protein